MNFPRRLVASILLMAYAVTGTSLMPTTLLLLATLDGSHAVQVRESGDGTQVILEHTEGIVTAEVKDHEEYLTKVLVSLSCPDSEGDHNLVSAHLTSSIHAERDVLKSVLKNTAMLNDSATCDLEFWATKLLPAMVIKGCCAYMSSDRITKESLMTVQLLI